MALLPVHMLRDIAKGVSDLAYNTDGKAYYNQKYLSLMYMSSLGEVVETFYLWIWPHLFVMVAAHLKTTM